MYRSIQRRWVLPLLVVLVVSVLVAGCGSPAGPDEPTQPMLPRVTVSVDEQGVPSVLGISLDMVSSLLAQDLTDVRISPALVQQMTAAGVQHLEIVLTEDDIFLFGNGVPLPYLSMDEATWDAMSEVASLLGLPIWNTVQWIRENVLSRFGVQILVKFPVEEGAEEIAARDTSYLPQVDPEVARAAVGDPSVVFHTEVVVDEEGVPTIGSLPLADLAEAGLGVSLAGTRLDPTLLATLTAGGIQHFQLETEPEGLYIYFNGQPLPRLTWDSERLSNLFAFAQMFNQADPNMPMIGMLVPALQATDLQLSVLLPRMEGAAELPLHDFMGP